MRSRLPSLFKCALLALAFSGPGSAFSSGEWASEVDLRAAFCLPVIKATSKELEDIMKQIPFVGSESDKKVMDNLGQVERFIEVKLSTYLSSRMASMNSKAVAQVSSAGRAGQAAFEVDRSIRNWCGAELRKNNTDSRIWPDELKKCTEKSGVKSLRLEACNDLSWLPY